MKIVIVVLRFQQPIFYNIISFVVKFIRFVIVPKLGFSTNRVNICIPMRKHLLDRVRNLEISANQINIISCRIQYIILRNDKSGKLSGISAENKSKLKVLSPRNETMLCCYLYFK